MAHKILVVDDEEIIRESLSFVLKKEGYLVEEAENGKTAGQPRTERQPSHNKPSWPEAATPTAEPATDNEQLLIYFDADCNRQKNSPRSENRGLLVQRALCLSD